MSAQDLRLHHRLQLATQALKKAADHHLLENTGISTAQAAVLAVVADQQGTSQRHIAAALELNESAVTAMVERLLKMGLVERRRSSNDGRVWQLLLTSLGAKRAKEAAAVYRSINRQVDAALTPAQQEVLAQCLDVLNECFRSRK